MRKALDLFCYLFCYLFVAGMIFFFVDWILDELAR